MHALVLSLRCAKWDFVCQSVLNVLKYIGNISHIQVAKEILHFEESNILQPESLWSESNTIQKPTA